MKLNKTKTKIIHSK